MNYPNFPLPEELLQFVWQQKWLLNKTLTSTTGERVEILKPGLINRESGPDFFQAQLRIGGTHWVGNVEIHKRSSDWFRHGHQFDPAYSNVILHVVWEEDEPVCRPNGERIPALELNHLLPESLLENYRQLMANPSPIPCASQFSLPAPEILELWSTRLALERLENKVERVTKCLNERKGDWEAVLYQLLARAFGRGTNALPFEMLAVQLPFKLINQLRDDLVSLQALLLGTAGLLPLNGSNEYAQSLYRQYQYLASKHALEAQDAHLWKYRGHRPSGFPVVRLLQFGLLQQQKNLLQKAIHANSMEELLQLFSPVSEQTFEVKPQRFEVVRIGRDQAQSLVLNAVLPVLFAFGKHQDHESLCEKAAEWQSQISAEVNRVTREFAQLGWKVKNATHSQGLLQLKHYYCRNHLCLKCAIGNHLLQSVSAS